MRKIIVDMMMSLDGFIAGPNNELDWIITGTGKEKDALDFYNANVDLVIIGRGVYPDMAGYWPTVSQNPAATKDDVAIADKVNALPKLVVTDRDDHEELTWSNSSLFLTKDENLVEKINVLKQQPGKDIIVWGGVRLAQSFVRHGLVDEYRLFVNPVALGRGKTLFEGITDRTFLQLISCKNYDSGIVALHYASSKN